MIEHSEQLTDLAAALSKAQGEIENAHKNAKNPHFKSSYADLAEIINTVRPVLTKHGLAVVQVPGFANGVVTVDTMLTHASGQWLRGVSAAPVAKPDPQGVGSATTYLRRYSLAALCAIAQEDDDGEAASRPQPRQQQKREPARDAQPWERVMPFGKETKGKALADLSDDQLRSARDWCAKNAPEKWGDLISDIDRTLTRREAA